MTCFLANKRTTGRQRTVWSGNAGLTGLTSSSCWGLRLRLFMLLFLFSLGHFMFSVKTSVTFSSNYSNFEKNLKKIWRRKKMKNPKTSKIIWKKSPKNSKNLKKKNRKSVKKKIYLSKIVQQSKNLEKNNNYKEKKHFCFQII